MAEAILSQISGDFLECTICLEPFKDPKILPCLHTFCKGCLEKFVEKQVRECARGHRRGKRTRDHEVIGVAELKEHLITKTSSVKSTTLPMCPKHHDEKLKFYCETCQHPICRDCTVLQHKDHMYNLLADVVSDVRAKIKGKLKVAMPKIEEYRDVASVTVKKQTELDTRSKKATDDIDAAAEEEIKYYSGLVRRKQTELKEKLAAVTAARSKQLSATADSVESTLGCLSSTVDFSQKVVEHGSDFDVMNVFSDVTARLESLLKGPTPNIPDDISYVMFDPRTESEGREIILGDIVGTLSSSYR
ncbi:tripartite motif-containing protein 2-like [Branchiostoma lanceolatum]|uniref:tripartite motif-containing protein 2-like n=1 Tax=Branchiostoma lanceolatum TaxID=7740 RepID=UPI0034544FEB